MGSILTNGVFLPAEGERNCYEGLAENWTALDGLIGGYNAHIGNATIHVTAADKEAWNGKADASALTAHTGDTTIHVTAEDKQAWNEHVADTVKHVTASDKQTWNGKQDALSQTQLDAVNSGIDSSKVQQIATNTSDISSLQSGKANDSDVVHKSGNENISGKKYFRDDLTIYNNDSSQSTKNLNISSSKIQVGDTSNSDAFGIRFNAGVSYVAQILAVNDTTGTQNLQLSLRTKDSSNNFITSMVRSRLSANGNSSFEAGANDSISLGSSSYKWKDVQTNQINGLEPSSLSLPSGNLNDIIDISSYLTYLDGSNANTYIAPANGWISIAMNNSLGIQAYINGLWGHQVVRPSVGGIRFFMPILKDKTTNILIFGGTIDNARFIPCQGNV